MVPIFWITDSFWTELLGLLDTYAAKTHETDPHCTFPSKALLLDYLGKKNTTKNF